MKYVSLRAKCIFPLSLLYFKTVTYLNFVCNTQDIQLMMVFFFLNIKRLENFLKNELSQHFQKVTFTSFMYK
jgi:hypothetical protein